MRSERRSARPGPFRLVVLSCALLSAVGGCGDGDAVASGNSGGPPARAGVHGVIEGFYGEPYDFDARLDLLRFLPRARLDTYVYAPKLDPFHRSHWREPYPAESMGHFATLAREGRRLGVRFVYGLSPGNDFDPDGDDQARIETKLGALFDAGVRDFFLLFDDLDTASKAADPNVQVRVVTDTLADLRRRSAQTRLWFVSQFYAGTAAEIRAGRSPFDRLFRIKSAVAYQAYASLPADVAIFWTGPRVFANPLTAADTAAFRELAGRPLLIWDNYPVNDAVLTNELFLAPYFDREPGVVRAAEGILLNTMLQPEASKIALWTAGRFFADPEAYDPDTALQEALAEVAGSAAGARTLARLADQFQSHPLIGNRRESAELADRVAAFFETGSASSRASLRELLQDYAGVDDDLQREVRNRRLVDELREPARKLSLFAKAGLLGLDLLDAASGGQQVDVDDFEALLAAADAVPWLVGANTEVAPGIDRFLSGSAALRADVFGEFFARLRAEFRG